LSYKYWDYWQLAENPFRNTADVRYYYPAEGHERALDRLLFAAEEGLGLAVFTGIAGCGKSLLARMLVDHISARGLCGIFLANPPPDETGLYVALLAGLGVPDVIHADLSTAQLGLLQLAVRDQLERHFDQGRRVVVVLDDAHLVPDDKLLQAISALLNYQMGGRFAASVLVVGQEALEDSLRSIAELARKVELRTSLEVLSDTETADYARHRLKVAGARREVFTPDALRCIFDLTGGLPFAINRFCDLALLAGYASNARQVDKDLIQDVRDEALGHTD